MALVKAKVLGMVKAVMMQSSDIYLIYSQLAVCFLRLVSEQNLCSKTLQTIATQPEVFQRINRIVFQRN